MANTSECACVKDCNELLNQNNSDLMRDLEKSQIFKYIISIKKDLPNGK